MQFPPKIAACAGCNQMDGWGTIPTGLGAGLLYMALSGFLLRFVGNAALPSSPPPFRIRIDDPLDAFAVHFGGGLWGLFSVCLVSNARGRGLVPSLLSGEGISIVRSLAVIQICIQRLNACLSPSNSGGTFSPPWPSFFGPRWSSSPCSVFSK